MVSAGRVLGITGKVVAVGMAVVVVIAAVAGGLVAAGAVDVEQPTVESVETEWGEVTDESTTLRTEVVVDNPNTVGVPGILSVEYAATMNDVTLVEGRKNGVGLSTGRNTLALEGEMDNDRIVDWWVTHVNGGESSTLDISASVKGPLGVSRTVPVEQTTFETDLLGYLADAEPAEITIGGERFLRVADQSASWGTADAEETPLIFSASVENAHDYPVTIDGFGYEVTMNDVVVGTGETADGVEVAPGATEQVEVRAAIDTPKMADWWASHVRNGESTNLSVQVYGYVEQGGERKRIPLNFVDRSMEFSTDFLGGGDVTVRPDESAGDTVPDVQQPSILGSRLEWGDVTDDVTEVRTSVTLQNPNDEAFSDLLAVEIEGTTTVNDVVVADDRTVADSIRPGENTITHVSELDNSKVPEWWAKHVNNGEQSTFVTEPEVAVDVGFTEFDASVEGQRGTIETDLLAGLRSDEPESFTAGGREVAVVHETSASWGHATPDVAPIDLQVTIENKEQVLITIRDLAYVVGLNDVVVADDTAPESYTLDPGETRTIEFTLELDNSKMDEWWVSHVRNGETTTASFDATVTVDAGIASAQADLSLPDQTIETDLLGDSGDDSQELVRAVS